MPNFLLALLFVLFLTDHTQPNGWDNIVDNHQRLNTLNAARAWVAFQSQWTVVPEWNPRAPRIRRVPQRTITHARCGNAFLQAANPLAAEALPSFSHPITRFCWIQTDTDYDGDIWLLLCANNAQTPSQCLGIFLLSPDSSSFKD